MLFSPAPVVGRTISHYRILALLGGGGMGVVYRAEDTRLGREVALKFLPSHLLEHEPAIERFRREARAASRINHPHICTVYDIGEDGQSPFLVMELLEGETLKQRLFRGRVDNPQLVEWGMQMAEALEAAHAAGIVHRDVKPANVFITNRGGIKILDFGLARLAASIPLASGAPTITTATVVAGFETTPGHTPGTVSYMSPEQSRGEDLDRRTDIFSLGIVLYEMATGELPFDGSTSAVVFEAILNREPPAPMQRNPHLPPVMDSIICKALKKDRKLRYQTAADLLADLGRLKRDSSGSVPVAPARPRWRTPLTIGTGVLAFTAATILLYWFKSGEASKRESQPHELVPLRVTSNTADAPIRDMALSPEGKYLAYSDSSGVHIRAMQSALSHLIPESKGLAIWWWNADSSEVFAARQSDSHLAACSISLLGGSVRQLGAGMPSPSGKYVVNLDKNLSELTRLSDNKVFSIAREGFGQPWLAWAPDEKRLAITYYSASGTSLEMLNLENGVWTTLLAKQKPVYDMSWISNQRLIYTRLEGPWSENGDLWEINLDSSKGRSSEPKRLTHWEAGAGTLSAAAAANRLCFLRQTSTSDIYWGEFQGQTARLGPLRRLTSQESLNHPYAWTLDGNSILLASNRDGKFRIYRQQLASETAEPVSSESEGYAMARLSPGGEWFLFDKRVAEKPEFRLIKRLLGGGSEQTLFSSDSEFGIACSVARDGGCIIVQNTKGGQNVLLLNADNGRVTKLFEMKGGITGWDFAPDGRHLAFEPAVPPMNKIRIVNLQGVVEKEITVAGAHLLSLSWSSLGTRMFCGDMQSASSRLLYVEPSGASHVLFEQPTRQNIWAIPSPNDKRIALFRTSRSTNVWMIENP